MVFRIASLKLGDVMFTVLGKADHILAVFNQVEQFSDFFGTEVKNVVLGDVGNELLLRGNGGFRTEESNSSSLSIF